MNAPPETLPRLSVLVVDDDRDTADSTADLLTLATGCKARPAYSGADALAAVAEETPHVALLDLQMPGADGFELAERLKKTGHRPLLVAVTGVRDADLGRRLRDAGFHLCLVKPVEPVILAGTVRRLAEFFHGIADRRVM